MQLPAVPAIVFLAAALACALIGRILLVNKAFGVSTLWGFTVVFVPFGPLLFRMNYRELAYPSRYWRMATAPLFLLFIFNGGNASVRQSFEDFMKKPAAEVASAGDTDFQLPETMPGSASTSAPAAESPTVPTATPSKGVAAALAAMPAAPRVLSLAERMEANRQEFERLADWYTNLKNERGYLRKGDFAAVEAYNAETARYQMALQLAKTEQADLAKLAEKQ